MKTILVPVDFSKNAENALKYAVQLAKKETYKIVLFHSYHYNYSGIGDSPDLLMDQSIFMQEMIEKKLKDLANKTNKNKKEKISCEIENRQGILSDTIEAVVKEKNIDLIVMGTQGATGFKEFFMGSNTARVISVVSCPVIAVPAKSSFKKIKKLVYATDYQAYDINALEQLLEIAQNFEASIDVLHVATGKHTHLEEIKRLEKFEEKVSKKMDTTKMSFNFLFGTEVDELLEEYMDKSSISFLAVSTKHRNLIDRIFGKSSVTKRIVNHTKVPLIAFHHK